MKKHGGKWRKSFSEDFHEIFQILSSFLLLTTINKYFFSSSLREENFHFHFHLFSIENIENIGIENIFCTLEKINRQNTTQLTNKVPTNHHHHTSSSSSSSIFLFETEKSEIFSFLCSFSRLPYCLP